MAEANIKAVITADDRASGKIAGFGGSFTKMAGAVATGIAVFETLKQVTFGVAAVFSDSIHAFMEQENATVRLKAALRNVHTAVNDNIDGLTRQASALEAVTRFSDEQITSAQGILATYQLNQDAIEKLTPSLLDMSEGIAQVSGGIPDLEGNARMLARALGGEDTDSFVGALNRGGIALTNHQQEILRTGTYQERFVAITEIMKDNVGGLAAAMGDTASGKFLQFQHAVNNLQEQLGAALFTALQPFIKTLTDWAKSDQARKTIQEIADKIVEFGRAAFEFLKKNWPEIKKTFETLATITWDVAKAIAAVSDAINRIPKPPAWLVKGVAGGVGIATNNPLLNLFGHRAVGGNVMAGEAYQVGEQGPETFVPTSSGRIIPGGGGGSTTINISPQIGIYAGTPMERRQLAEQLLLDLKDIASSKGIDLMGLMAR